MTARKWYLVAAFLAVACGSDTGPSDPVDQGQEGEGVLGEWVWSGGGRRFYTLRQPPSYQDGEPAPLFIGLHGAGDTGFDFAQRMGLDPVTDEAGFLAVYPDGVGNQWAPSCGCTDADIAGINDLLFVNTLITHLAENLTVDTTRIYVAGFSQGGLLAESIGCVLAGRVAAVASVAATMHRGVASACRPAESMPILYVHGSEDAAFPYLGNTAFISAPSSAGWWAASNGCADDPQVAVLPDTASDGTVVTSESYDGCVGGAEVVFFGIDGGGHTWPGAPGPFPSWTGLVSGNLDGGREIVSFFQRQAPR